MKLLLFICGLFLFVGLVDLPDAYYTFLRILVPIVALIIIIVERANLFSFWNIVFLLVAILFNPFFPFYLNNNEAWEIIAIVCGILFMLKANTYKKIIDF